MRIDNLADARAEIQRLRKDLDALARQSTLGHSSVTRGQLRVASTEGLKVEGTGRVTGTLYIDGLEQVDGTLRVNGTLDVNGPSSLDGATTVNGNLTVNPSSTMTVNGALDVNGTADLGGNTNVTGTLTTSGNTTIGGTLNVTGDTTISNDLDVTGGGTIQAGAVTITPANGGKIMVGNTTIASDGSISNTENSGLRVNRISVSDPFVLTQTMLNLGAQPMYMMPGGSVGWDANNIG